LSTEVIGQGNIWINLIKPYLKESHQLPPSISENLRYIINAIVIGRKLIKEKGINLIHTNSWTPVIAGSILSRLSGVPVISAIVDVFTGNEFGGWSRWAEINRLPPYHAVAARLLESLSLKMPTSLYHTISKTSSDDILAVRPNAKIKVVYPGIDVSEYANKKDKIQYCDFILFIGRLIYYKNVDVLIKAFKPVVDSIPAAKLVIVGEGPMKEPWKEMATNAGLDQSVLFQGNISSAEKVKLLSQCSAVALPSVFEGFGLVILEAFAMAKPVLVSDVKPFDEIVDDGTDGFILPRDNHQEWSKKMQYLLIDKASCKKMGEKGLPKAYEKFSLEKSLDQMESLYKSLIERIDLDTGNSISYQQ
jgi:glycosyltransferase involved in cell wall biosynthesis